MYAAAMAVWNQGQHDGFRNASEGQHMYIVTGGAGFIGSNLVHELNHQGISDILVVDNLSDSRKIVNLHGARFVDYMDKGEFRRAIAADRLGIARVQAIFHQGACSNTLLDDGMYMMDDNFTCSKEILEYAIRQNAPLRLCFDRRRLRAQRSRSLHAHTREREAAQCLWLLEAGVRSLCAPPDRGKIAAHHRSRTKVLQRLRSA